MLRSGLFGLADGFLLMRLRLSIALIQYQSRTVPDQGMALRPIYIPLRDYHMSLGNCWARHTEQFRPKWAFIAEQPQKQLSVAKRLAIPLPTRPIPVTRFDSQRCSGSPHSSDWAPERATRHFSKRQLKRWTGGGQITPVIRPRQL